MDCPEIQIENGRLKGKVSEPDCSNAQPVYMYLSVPYGKSTSGERRFAPPEPAENWEGTLEATETLTNCPQNVGPTELYDQMLPQKDSLNFDKDKSTEDCLRLSVFTPSTVKTSSLPVMVWLTGGHYERNFAGRVDGTAVSGMNNVVTVIVNFRVNIFGYLSLGKNSVCPGNLALMDVILALKWVRQNIRAFGGNPENVTLFGESSGSGMVHLLMMSDLSQGLFHKAILLSGSTLSPFLCAEDTTAAGEAFLNALNIDKDIGEKQILQELRNRSIENLMDAQSVFNDFMRCMPTIDGHVLKDSPENLTKAGHVHRVPLLIGCTNSEGHGLISATTYPDFFEGTSEENVKKLFQMTFNKIYKKGNAEEAFEMLKEAYLSDVPKDDPTRYSLLHGDMVSDSIFVIPTIMTAIAHTSMGLSTYLFQMTQQPEFNHDETNGPGVLKKPAFVKCDHADDMHFVWGAPFVKGELPYGARFTEDEKELSRNVMTYFTNFAKTGNPNNGQEVPREWPQYTLEEQRHMILQTPLLNGQRLNQDKVVMYTQKFPAL
ncbi:carboxylesterase 5A-like [Ciona intestinalis]